MRRERRRRKRKRREVKRSSRKRRGGGGGAEEEKEEDEIIGKRKGIGGSKSQTKKFEYDGNKLYIYTKYLSSFFIMNICFKTF